MDNLSGDRKSDLLSGLYEKYKSVLCFYASRYTGSYWESEDIVHSVFANFLSKEIKLNDENALRSYLFSAVHNACLNNIAQKSTAKKYYAYALLNETDKDESGYLSDRIETEVLWEVFSKIEQLPSECKKVFKLSYLENMSNQEIADELSISVNTVKSQKSRAKQLLKESLKGLFVFAVAIFGL